MAEDPTTPSEVEDLVQMAQSSVKEVVGVEPDLTPETLPLVDEYLRQVGPGLQLEVRDLVISAVGCYFGEVVRRKLNGRWNTKRSSPQTWRIELVNCFLHFHPVGMAGEVLTGAETEDYDGSFATLDVLRDGLAHMLSEAAPMSEEEYYSLAGRIDILQLAADWLVGRSLASGKPLVHLTAKDYSELLDQDLDPGPDYNQGQDLDQTSD